MDAARKYYAASIPRSIRAARLRQLRLENIVGSWSRESQPGQLAVFDVIMLPAQEFTRARAMLASPDVGMANERGGMTPPYIPADVKEVTVPDGESDPFAFAKAYFKKAFGLDTEAS